MASLKQRVFISLMWCMKFEYGKGLCRSNDMKCVSSMSFFIHASTVPFGTSPQSLEDRIVKKQRLYNYFAEVLSIDE